MLSRWGRQIASLLNTSLSLFLIVGLGVTLASALSYWVLADLGGMDPNLALGIVFVVFMLVGFVSHGNLSFRGHARDTAASMRLGRYALVNVTGLILNQLFVYILVKRLGGEVWWPVVPMVLVTPWLVFALNRFWVFPEVSHDS